MKEVIPGEPITISGHVGVHVVRYDISRDQVILSPHPTVTTRPESQGGPMPPGEFVMGGAAHGDPRTRRHVGGGSTIGRFAVEPTGTDEPIPAEAPTDPWRHRAENMRCGSCMWFVRKEAGEDKPILGRCRRHAPTMNGFPAVFETDWCGDHKLDETKL